MNAYKKVMLKLSGEALQGTTEYGIDPDVLADVSKQICEVRGLGIDVMIVIGGGNIFRGVAASAEGMDRANADYVGMLATVMNAIALQDSLEKLGLHTRVLSAISIQELCEPYIRRRAVRHLEKGRVVIFAGGTGNPYFTTDTAAALRAIEMHADVLFKATKVDGVYDKDPAMFSDAKLIPKLSYRTVVENELRVMDTTAVTLCMENKLSIQVFNLLKEGNLIKVLSGAQDIGTQIGSFGE